MDILKTILTILLAIDCIVLIVLVLLQEGKEGGCLRSGRLYDGPDDGTAGSGGNGCHKS